MKLTQILDENWDSLGDVDIELDEGDIVTDLLVVARVTSLQSTDDNIILGVSKGMAGITQYGIVCAAKLQVEQWMINGDDDE